MRTPRASYGRRSAAVGIVLAVALVLTGAGTAAGSSSDAASAGARAAGDGTGTVHEHSYASVYGVNPYLVYTPKAHRKKRAWPLFVMVHGCATTAAQQMHANEINALADTEKFVVMYPDINQVNAGRCWRAIHGDPTSITRGAGGDADILAAMVQDAAKLYNADRSRIYIIGMSSGAFQTSATLAAYPELFAAGGVNAGGGYAMNWSCAALTDDIVPVHAALARDEMGSRASVIPFFAIGGDADPLGEQAAPGGCSRLAFKQWMSTNNLLLSGTGDAVDEAAPATRSGRVPGGHAWTAETVRTTRGCLLGEHWVVKGMGHYWSGGSEDPQWAAFTDPKGPDAAVAAWRFFSKFRKGATSACAR